MNGIPFLYLQNTPYDKLSYSYKRGKIRWGKIRCNNFSWIPPNEVFYRKTCSPLRLKQLNNATVQRLYNNSKSFLESV